MAVTVKVLPTVKSNSLLVRLEERPTFETLVIFSLNAGSLPKIFNLFVTSTGLVPVVFFAVAVILMPCDNSLALAASDFTSSSMVASPLAFVTTLEVSETA